jgi:diadenosine tetraphosphate (Ap4A) HIT family hydrolase
MKAKIHDCLFCNIPSERIIAENEYAFAMYDEYPVTDRHALIIPKRHVDNYFQMTSDELLGCDSLLKQVREAVLSSDHSVAGFNVGMNAGVAAGQTIFHCHIHLIPRREGDVENPRGGVRHVIPDKGNY